MRNEKWTEWEFSEDAENLSDGMEKIKEKRRFAEMYGMDNIIEYKMEYINGKPVIFKRYKEEAVMVTI